MTNTKRYYVTQKLVVLYDEFVDLADRKAKILHPDLDATAIDMIVPPISVWDAGDQFADLGDYSDLDVPRLDKMVELGYLEVK